MFTFTSVAAGYMVFGKPVLQGKEMIPEFEARFVRQGAVGIFTTSDEQLAEKLRTHPSFGTKFVELSPPKPESNIVKGIRSSETHPELGKGQLDPQRLIRFGVLQNKLLKQDGTYRRDATQEEISEYENLKKELEN